jgi:hypothetical protein
MANTLELIASSTVGAGGTTSITFSSIPATYTDLVVKCSLRGSQSAVYTDVDISFTGATYSGGKVLYAINGTTVGSYGPGSNGFFAEATGATATASTFSNSEFYVPNYTSSINKLVSGDAVGENNASAAIAILGAGLYTSSGAITALTLTYGTGSQGNFVQYSTAYLYGVKNA